jgi:Alr-MurF fusion protein
MLLHQIAKLTTGKLINDSNYHVDTLIIDSRKIIYAQSALFICLVTNKDNGHHYVAEAYQKGIRSFLVSEMLNFKQYNDACFILVNNTLHALQQIVAEHRGKFTYPVIGITGSNGKTIVKEWLYQLLDANYHIVRSPKSYNSQIGVALSVWEMSNEYNLGIFEAGISKVNEMHNLAKMIQPSIAIFTNIGDPHSENFESIEQKIKEKILLMQGAHTIIYCSNHILIHQAIFKHTNTQAQILSWGTLPTDTLCIINQQQQQDNTTITAQYKGKKYSIILPFTNEAAIENACHCWLTTLHLGLSDKTIAARMLTLQPVAMRLELKQGVNNCTIINDSYNSDIGALQIALDFLLQQTEHKKYTLILSDILQSKKSDFSLYQEVVDLIVEKKITKFIGIGNAISQHKSSFEQHQHIQCFFYNTTHQFLEHINLHQFAHESILLKGARSFAFEKISLALEEKIHQTVLEINLNAIADNYNTYAQLINKEVHIMAMVKAYSYGNGGYEIARKLQLLGATYLAVAYADEGVLLRNSGITLPIMVMNPDAGAFNAMISYAIEPEIYSLHTLQQFIAACNDMEANQIPIHLKLDTGMHRLGFKLNDVEQAVQIIANNQCVKLQSVFSHLAASDDASLDEFTQQQAIIFEQGIAIIDKYIKYNYYKHLCNTSGIVRHPALHYNMVRLGIGLYGIDNSGLLGKSIKQVSKLKTTIAQIKELNTGDTVGYSRKGIVHQPSKIATVCIGYADGIRRSLSNGVGKMMIKGTLVSIIGNVCMDMCMLDVTHIPQVQEGDEVIIFGPEYPISRFAEASNTIAYEVMTGIGTRVKRVFYEE